MFYETIFKNLLASVLLKIEILHMRHFHDFYLQNPACNIAFSKNHQKYIYYKASNIVINQTKKYLLPVVTLNFFLVSNICLPGLELELFGGRLVW